MKSNMAWPALAGGGLMLMASAASAEVASPDAPAWIQIPSVDALLAAIPQAALRIEGASAVVDCNVDATGALGDCKLVSETPKELGLGAAALGLAYQYRLAGNGTAHRVRFTETFSQPAFDTPPGWRRKPRQEDLLVVWPQEAWKHGQGGEVVLRCVVGVEGILRGCRATRETPAGAGFGSAAISLTPQMLMKPATKDGKAVPSVVSMPLNFMMPAGAPPKGTVGMRMHLDAAIAWTKAPTLADVIAAYPAKARAQRASGYVNMTCSLAASGKLTGCSIVNQTPGNLGFAAAAKSLVEKFQAPTTIGDQPINKFSVQIPVTFSTSMLDPGDAQTGKPRWAAFPTGDQLTQAFAKTTATAGVSTVRVALLCLVAAEGLLENCSVEREEPMGHGFGQQALSLTPHFKLTTWTIEGLPTIGGRVRIPLRYELEPPVAAAAAPEKPAS